MNVVVIGPSDRSLLWRYGTVKEDEYDSFIDEYVAFLARYFENVIVTPDGGVYTDIAQRFGKVKKTKPIAYYPDGDGYYGFEHLKENFEHYDVKPILGDWYKLNADLTKLAPVVICVGMSPGTMIEIAFLKFHQKYGGRKDEKLGKIHLFIDRRCIGQKLDPSFEEQIENIYYYDSLEELGELLQQNLSLFEDWDKT